MPIIHLNRRPSDQLKRALSPVKGRYHPFKKMDVHIDPSTGQYDKLRYPTTLFILSSPPPVGTQLFNQTEVSLNVNDPLIMTKIAWEVHDVLKPRESRQ